MRFCVLLGREGGGYVRLPIHYNHLVQGMIYENLPPQLADFLHDRGFTHGKRAFKLFTFSRLMGDGRASVSDGTITLKGPIRLWVSSPVEPFVRELANSMVRRGEVVIGGEGLKVEGLYIPKAPEMDPPVVVKTLSPITAYSTLYTLDGRKKTYYYTPMEEDFSRLIDENAKKKYQVLYGKRYKSSLTIKPLKVREAIVLYKGTVIKGWTGTFTLDGPKGLIKIAYEAGLGSKNSQGFGMVEVVKCA